MPGESSSEVSERAGASTFGTMIMRPILSCLPAFFAMLFFAAGVSAQTPEFLDSLRSRLQSENNPDEKCRLYADLSRAYCGVDLDSALAIADRGLDYSHALAKDHFRGRLYNAMAVAAISSGQKEIALTYIDSAIAIERLRNDKSGLAGSIGNKGAMLFVSSRYPESQKLQFECLKLYEELGDQHAIATTWTNIHGTYFILKDWENALSAGYKALEIFRAENDLMGQGYMFYNLAAAYFELGNIDSSEVFAHEALRVFELKKSEEGVADGKRVLADVARAKGDFATAIRLDKEACEVYLKIGGMYKYAQALANLAEVYEDAGDFSAVRETSLICLEVSKNHGLRQIERDSYYFLMKASEGLGDYKSYYDYSTRYIALKDSILNEDALNKLNLLHQEFELERKEQENLSLRQREEILELEIQRKNWYIGLSVLALAAAGAIAFYIHRSRRLKQDKRNLQLRQQLLRAQMNPHFVFNSLSAIQSFVYSSEPLVAGKYLSSFARLLRGILDYSAKEWILLSKEIEWLQNYMELQKLRFDQSFDFEIIVSDQLPVDRLQVPPMLCQPFVENAIEHGFKNLARKGHLRIEYKLHEGRIEVMVEDNGIGFNASSNEFVQEGEKHALEITRERLALLNSNGKGRIDLKIESKAGEGTRICFTLPYREDTA